MSTRRVYLCLPVFLMLLATYSVYGQTGSPGYKDTSQTITKEELILEKTVHKTKVNKAKSAKKQARGDAKIVRLKKQNVSNKSRDSQKADWEEKSVQTSRKNAGSASQKNFDARDKADK